MPRKPNEENSDIDPKGFAGGLGPHPQAEASPMDDLELRKRTAEVQMTERRAAICAASKQSHLGRRIRVRFKINVGRWSDLPTPQRPPTTSSVELSLLSNQLRSNAAPNVSRRSVGYPISTASRHLEFILMALRAVVLRRLVYMVAEIAVGLLAIMRRVVRVGRL